MLIIAVAIAGMVFGRGAAQGKMARPKKRNPLRATRRALLGLGVLLVIGVFLDRDKPAMDSRGAPAQKLMTHESRFAAP